MEHDTFWHLILHLWWLPMTLPFLFVGVRWLVLRSLAANASAKSHVACHLTASCSSTQLIPSYLSPVPADKAAPAAPAEPADQAISAVPGLLDIPNAGFDISVKDSKF